MNSNTKTSKSSSDWNDSDSDIALKFPFFNVLKDGRVHVFTSTFEKAPPSDHPVSAPGVKTKDIQISSEISARVFVPEALLSSSSSDRRRRQRRLPLVLYVHGGGFCMQSAFSVEYSGFVARLVAEGDFIAVSVEYTLFPKGCIPACYEDCWAALQWVASHGYRFASDGKWSNPEPWISDHADLSRIFVAGDSGGANISYNVMVKASSFGLLGDAKVEGMILVHPFFLEGEKMWLYMCPTNQGPKDPRLKPTLEDLGTIRCEKVLVVLAEKDGLYDSGKEFVDDLIKSGWKGRVEIMENKGKDHVFHLYDPMDPEAVGINRRISEFIHSQD